LTFGREALRLNMSYDNYEEVYLNDLEDEDFVDEPSFPEDEWDDNDEELTDTFDFILNNNTLR
jgi:hypothetical protein